MVQTARKPTKAPKPKTARLCTIPRDQLRIDDLSRQIETEGVELPLEQLGADAWQLEAGGVTKLMAKIHAAGIPLAEFAAVTPLYGVKTGFNDAFVIDAATRQTLVAADPGCSEIIKPFLRGQDLDRWASDWHGLWMIFARRGINIDEYPSVKHHLSTFRQQLEPKPRDWAGGEWPGRKPGTYKWFEIQDAVDYWREFSKPKIMYPEITWRANWGLDHSGTLCNNTAYFLPSDDLWILAATNAPITWWYSWRTAMHGKDEALRFLKDYVQIMPIPKPTDKQRSAALPMVTRLIEITEAHHAMRATILDWLRVEHSIDKASLKLQAPTELNSDSFVAEVKRIRGKKNPLSVAALKSLRDEHARTIEPARAQAAQALQLERQLSDLVNEAYGLTPAEVALLWETAPPRMPFALGNS